MMKHLDEKQIIEYLKQFFAKKKQENYQFEMMDIIIYHVSLK